ncbi:MAG: hypothetical protein ABSH28_02025 [Acidobacteriota bacterium]|jgi:hypothetical protein
MKRPIVLIVVALVFTLVAGASVCFAQGTFKVPFTFQAGDKKFPAGDYRIARKGSEQITLRQEPNGGEVVITILKTLAQPNPPFAEPQLIFDVVGNFEPSYTEYVTDYVLAEVWLPGQDGSLLHVTKGAHSRQTIKGQKAGK